MNNLRQPFVENYSLVNLTINAISVSRTLHKLISNNCFCKKVITYIISVLLFTFLFSAIYSEMVIFIGNN